MKINLASSARKSRPKFFLSWEDALWLGAVLVTIVAGATIH